MTIARRQIVDANNNGYYHCIGRCVRQSYLCGFDTVSGRDFSHRKQWIVDRLKALTSLFAIDVVTPAIMGNHYHLVVRIRPKDVQDWSDQDVARRWLKACSLWTLDQTTVEPPDDAISEVLLDPRRLIELRKRLASISWFMKFLNEYIARWANREDGCRGHFWSGRFQCKQLLDEPGLLTCMMYVDLNPIRAQLAGSISEEQVTGAFLRFKAERAEKRLGGLYERLGRCLGIDPNVRISRQSIDDIAARLTVRDDGVASTFELSGLATKHMKRNRAGVKQSDGGAKFGSSSKQLNRLRKKVTRLTAAIASQKELAGQADWLQPLDGHRSPVTGLSSHTYLQLLDETGRVTRKEKRGVIGAETKPLLEAMKIDSEAWLTVFDRFEAWFPVAAGRAERLKARAEELGRRWFRGISLARKLFGHERVSVPIDKSLTPLE